MNSCNYNRTLKNAFVHLAKTMAVIALLLLTSSPMLAFQSDGEITEAKTASQKIDSVLADFDSPTSPGIIVGVWQEGDWLFKKAYGMADLSQGLAITEDTKFNLGSVSKQFLGYAFALLHHKEELSLDDPVSDYVDDWPDFEHEVTLRHMLTHTSGTRTAYDMFGIEGRELNDDFLPKRKAYEAIRQQGKLDFVPGSKWYYNSMAFTILADILETVTETPADEWMQTHIFDPLDMDDTVIETKVRQVFPGLAESYEEDSEFGYIESQSNRAIFGAADVITTIDDMGKWADNILHGKVGGPKVVDIFTEPFILNDGEDPEYALGIGVTKWRGLDTYYHSGGHAGFVSFIRIFPELNAAIIELSNNNSPNTDTMEISEWYFGEHLSEEEADPENEIASDPEIEISNDKLKQYTGHFLETTNEGLYALNFAATDSGLSYQINYISEYFPLKPVGEHLFYNSRFNNNVEFVVSNDSITALKATFSDQVNEYKRIKKWAPSQQELKNFEGQYVNPETHTIYTLELPGEELVAKHKWNPDRVLTPFKKNIFYGFYTILQIEFAIDDQGQPIGFYMHDPNFQSLWFDRIDIDEAVPVSSND